MQKDLKIAAGICVSTLMLLCLSWVLPFDDKTSVDQQVSAVSVEGGVQVITIAAKGGFSPQHIVAQSGLPTELHVITNGTYDCSSTLVIPSLAYDNTLQPTGTEIISLSPEQATGILNGTCGMGMYSFDVAFN